MAGLVVGAIGLAVSAAAFVVAVWQIRKTQTAAESAAQSASEAREAVQHAASLIDLSEIIVEIDLLREIHRSKNWKRALDKYSSLERSLTRARPNLPDETRGKLNTAIVRLQRIEKMVSELDDRDEPIPVALANSELVDLRQSLSEVRAELEEHITGEGGQ